MGFEYEHMESLPLNTQESHTFFPGNHENFDKMFKSTYCLGMFGHYKSPHKNLNIFYIGGADSIDKAYRIEGVSWWRQEEMNRRQAEECLDKYELLFGKEEQENTIVLSHDCPHWLANGLWGYEASFTRKLLDAIWEIRKPKLWVFGHHHKSIDMTVDGCRFVCLNELETLII
jgi:hypothetical protein